MDRLKATKLSLFTKTTTKWSIECELNGKTVQRALKVLADSVIDLPNYQDLY